MEIPHFVYLWTFGWFQFLAVTHKATLNILVLAFFWLCVLISVDMFLGVGLQP